MTFFGPWPGRAANSGKVVATDGTISARRQEAIFAITEAAGVKHLQIAFLTAYRGRDSAGFQKTVARLAWGSFAWFASELGSIIILDGGTSAARLSELIDSS